MSLSVQQNTFKGSLLNVQSSNAFQQTHNEPSYRNILDDWTLSVSKTTEMSKETSGRIRHVLW